MPWGSSPMQPEEWAPMGLKYLSRTAFQACWDRVGWKQGADYFPEESRGLPLPPLISLLPSQAVL